MSLKAIAVAAAIWGLTITQGVCGVAPPVPPPAAPPPPSPGPWYVGGAIVSALSLMICSEWTCYRTHKEMSPEEAAWAATIPLSCLWWRPYPGEHIGPVCKGPPRP